MSQGCTASADQNAFQSEVQNQIWVYCLQPPEPTKPAEGPEFKLPDVPKLTFDTPKEIADKALPEALKKLPPPPTPSEPRLVNFTMHICT